ncbi:MAG: transposase family protein [Candidatus Spyradosoma sp.]
MDTVALGGGSTSGEFFWILTVTDVYSGYTRIWPVWNRTSENVAEALRRLLPSLPFAPVELHSDNGSEFINSEVFRAVKSLFPRCSMDRSRPYHKNDNAHVEQKNGALVRGLFGELRLDEFSCREALERACELASLRHNHFIPSRKALRKTRDPLTGTTRTRYAKAATPAARLDAFEGLSESSRAVLREESAGTHFLELNRKLRELLAEVVRTTFRRRACGASADLGAAGAGASPSDSASPPPSGNPRPPLAKTSPESSLPGCTSL